MNASARRPIPDRKFFKIGEVAQTLGVAASAIRYWQQQFWPHVRPSATKSGHRVYSRRDVSVLAMVQELVREQGCTIQGARERLRAMLGDGGKGGGSDIAEQPVDWTSGTSGPGVDNKALLDEIAELHTIVGDLRGRVEAAESRAVEADARAGAAEAALAARFERWKVMERRIREAAGELARLARD